MVRPRILAGLWLTCLACVGEVFAQGVQIATTSTAPVKVILTWPASPPTKRYNVYRKRSTDAAYPSSPINAAPLSVYTSCSAIRGVMPEGSAAWNSVAEGLKRGDVAFDPCAIATVTSGSAAWRTLQALAQAQWQVAVVLGQGYVDSGVPVGPQSYSVHGINLGGGDTGRIYPPVSIVAGAPVSVPAPTGVTASIGDSRVLLYWTAQPRAAGYAVYRSASAAGPFQLVSDGTSGEVRQTLDGTSIAPSPGFLDAVQWTPEGLPSSGPVNGNRYYYRVASVDLLGRKGPTSNPVQAVPRDSTPPVTPMDVVATANDVAHTIEMRWSIVQLDVDGHVDSSSVTSYRLYRYNDVNAPPDTGTPVGGPIPAPASPTLIVQAADNSPVLIQPFGEKSFWYRVQAIDGAGNASAFSAAAEAHLKDFTPPAAVAGLAALGFDNYIKLTWTPNGEADLEGYGVYRSLCHNGICNPCDPAVDKSKPTNPCTGPYALIATIGVPAATSTDVTFEDRTIPSRSPVCYSYWIRAFDRAQNVGGGLPNAVNVPGPADKTVCARLVDKTPPEAAIITGLPARSDSVQVQWIGAPVQDIAAYHVYRSNQKDSGYAFVGGMTVAIPPALPAVLTSRYTPPATVGCDGIPLTLFETLSVGAFVDTSVVAKRTYWYKVVGIDQSGNEASLNAAVPISTFTYSSATPAVPLITSVAATTALEVGLAIDWSPPFDPAKVVGYAVFRSDSEAGQYRQIGSVVSASRYVDVAVAKGVTYWYKVAAVGLRGQISATSAPRKGIP